MKTNVSFNINSRTSTELRIYYEQNKGDYADFDEFLSQMLDLGLSRKIQLSQKEEGLYFDDEEYTSPFQPGPFVFERRTMKPSNATDIKVEGINQNRSEDKE